MQDEISSWDKSHSLLTSPFPSLYLSWHLVLSLLLSRALAEETRQQICLCLPASAARRRDEKKFASCKRLVLQAVRVQVGAAYFSRVQNRIQLVEISMISRFQPDSELSNTIFDPITSTGQQLDNAEPNCPPLTECGVISSTLHGAIQSKPSSFSWSSSPDRTAVSVL